VRLRLASSGVLTLAMITALGLHGPSPSSASAEETASPTAVVVGGRGQPAEMPISDAHLLAQSLGISPAQAEADYSGQNEFLQAVGDVYMEHPDLFSSSAWEPESFASRGYKGWVSFAGIAPDEVIKKFESVPVPVQLRFHAPASSEHMEEIRREAMAAVYSQTPHLAGLTGDFSESGELLIRYEVAGGESAELSATTVEQTVRAVERGGPIAIRVERVTGIAPEEEVVRGGVAFSSCTTGFAATRGRTKGAVTAGHCDNWTTVNPTGSAYPLRYVLEHEGAYGDSQFHSTVDSISNSIRISSSGSLRAITASAFPSNGAAVCNYGKTRTTAACTTIRNADHAFYNTDGVYLSRMAQSNGTFTNGGDSGGPWYYSATAYGVHYGKSGGYSTMSRVNDVEAILSVNIPAP
jgi:hypothetical protein